jgi:hypothetical protein
MTFSIRIKYFDWILSHFCTTNDYFIFIFINVDRLPWIRLSIRSLNSPHVKMYGSLLSYANHQEPLDLSIHPWTVLWLKWLSQYCTVITPHSLHPLTTKLGSQTVVVGALYQWTCDSIMQLPGRIIMSATTQLFPKKKWTLLSIITQNKIETN